MRSLNFPRRGDEPTPVTRHGSNDCPDEFRRTLLPTRRLKNGLVTPRLRNLVDRVEDGRARPHQHVWELLTTKQDSGESDDDVLAFPLSLMARLRLRRYPVPPPVDLGSLCDDETAFQSDLDRMQMKLLQCVTPGLIHEALTAVQRYRARLDALESFLRTRLAAMRPAAVR